MANEAQTTSGRISPRDAANRAAQYLTELVSELWDIALEEVELSDDERFWYITLSYREPNTIFDGPKKYKIFTIDSTNGEVRSMKIRPT